MLSAALTPGQQLWLVALLVIWAGLLFGGFVFGRPNLQQTRRMPAWTRMLSSLSLVIAGWSWFWFARAGDAGTFALFVAMGMTFGLLGDLFMAHLLPISEPTLGGIAAFGVGHLAYITAFIRYGAQHGLTGTPSFWGAWAAWLLVGITGWYLAVYRGQRPTPLHLAALPYALLLASSAGLATGLALQAPSFWTLAIGAGLFLLSDLILAAHLFNNTYFRLIDDVVWLTYGPGQMLIVYGISNSLRGHA